MAPRGDIPEQPRKACQSRSGYQSLLSEEQSRYGATGRDGSDSQVSRSEDINLGPPQYNILLCLRTDGWGFAFAGVGSTMIQHPLTPMARIGRSKWSKRTVPISPPGTSTQRNRLGSPRLQLRKVCAKCGVDMSGGYTVSLAELISSRQSLDLKLYVIISLCLAGVVARSKECEQRLTRV